MQHFKHLVLVGMLAAAVSATNSGCAQGTDQQASAQSGEGSARSGQASAPSAGAAVDVINKAAVAERLVERSAPRVPAGARPRASWSIRAGRNRCRTTGSSATSAGCSSIGTTTSGCTTARGRSTPPTPGRLAKPARTRRAIRSACSDIHDRYGQLSGCCIPAPSVLEFDKAGNLLQAWGGPGDPGFLEKTMPRSRTDASGRRVSTASTSITTTSSTSPETARRENFHGQFPWAPNFGNDSQVLKFKTDGTFVYQIGKAGAKGPNSNDTNGGINGTPQPFLPADMTVDPKTNHLYIADGYGNRRVLIVDAETGKYVGHFGAYGQNPVQDETVRRRGRRRGRRPVGGGLPAR